MTKFLQWTSLLIILLGCTSDKPVSTDRGFVEKKINYYNTSEQFNYDRLITSKPNPVLQFFSRVIRGIAWFLNTIFGYVMIASLVVLLIWILFRYVNQERVNYTENSDTLHIIDESKLDEIDFIKLISKAVASSNYRLAIRYTFLNTLKGLSLHKLITVKDGKTNYEYYHELPMELKAKYRQILAVFEYVWYGEFDSSSAVYEQIDSSAKELQELIKKSDA
jgi:hypothetical protein